MLLRSLPILAGSRSLVVGLLGALALGGCEGRPTTPPPPPGERAGEVDALVGKGARQEVETLLQRQAADWSAGKLEAFCAVYADDAVFLSPKGKTVGRQAILDRYHKRYREDGAQMGALTLELEDVRVAPRGDMVSVAMRWTLVFPPADGAAAGAEAKSATGLSLVTLQRRAGGWQIVQDASM